MKQVTTTNEIEKISVIGIVSFAAVVHSHLYWVYSIIYIAYHKISPPPPPVTRSITPDKKKKRHHKKKSLTSKPKTIIPSVKEHVPILHAYNTFPSTKTSSSIHKLIQSQRKKTSLDDDELLYTSCSSNEDLPCIKKRGRALTLLRSTFNLKQTSSSEDETIVIAKPKKHTTILRKLSVKERPKLSLRTFSWKNKL